MNDTSGLLSLGFHDTRPGVGGAGDMVWPMRIRRASFPTDQSQASAAYQTVARVSCNLGLALRQRGGPR